MNDTAQRLRAAFAAQEDLAPDTASVLAGVEAAVVRHRRRRRALRATGGAALAAGVTGAFLLSTSGIPGLTDRSATSPATSSATSTPAPVPTYEGRFLDAFADRGYTYADAVALADLWDLADAGAGKATGGEKLLAGLELPIEAGSTPADYETSDDHASLVFLNADYTYEDALVLAGMWELESESQAKVKGGRILMDGGILPVEPGSAPSSGPGDPGDGGAWAAAWNAYAEAGYDYVDAHYLAALWVGSTSAATGDLLSDVKADAGQKILDGIALPITPGQPQESEDVHVPTGSLERFAGAGYDYDDAVALRDSWNLSSTADAKSVAGLRLAAGLALPIAPGSAPEVPVSDDDAVAEFFSAGYDYDDAVALAALWSSAEAYDAKVQAGRKLLEGIPVPIEPGSAPSAEGVGAAAPLLEGVPTAEELNGE